MDEFWTGTLSSVAAAAIGWVFSALVGILTRKSRWKPVEKEEQPAEKVYAQNAYGNQVVVAGDEFGGNIQILDDRTIVHQNMSFSSPPAKENENSGAELVPVVVGALVASALFLTFRVPLMWFTVGMVCGLLMTLIVAVRRTFAAHVWSQQAVGTVFEVVVAIAVTISSWFGVLTQSWHGNSIESISQKVLTASDAHLPPSGMMREPFDLITRATELLKANPPYSVTVVLVMLGAVFLSGTLLVKSWSSLFDWLAYVGFRYGTASQRLGRRAERFENRGWKDWVASLVLGAITATLASGAFFMFVDAAQGTN